MASKPTLPTTQIMPPPDVQKKGANRSTKAAHKLKVLPEQLDIPTQSTITVVDEEDEDGDDEEDNTGSTSDVGEDGDEEDDAEVCHLYTQAQAED
jgi:hypothetical protein